MVQLFYVVWGGLEAGYERGGLATGVFMGHTVGTGLVWASGWTAPGRVVFDETHFGMDSRNGREVSGVGVGHIRGVRA